MSDAAPLPEQALGTRELAEVLAGIDENLREHPIHPDAARRPIDEALDPLPDQLQELRSLDAPYFATAGPRGWLRRPVNLLLRVFGSKQRGFNGGVLDAVQTIHHQLRQLRLAGASDTARLTAIERRLDEIERRLAPPATDR
ncbi:MAG: hypothetical protein U0821_22565 [Chloroflexota bacterium]